MATDLLLALDGLDLSKLVRLPDGEGFDPQGDILDPQYAGVPALAEGAPFVGYATKNREWVIPLALHDATNTVDGANQLIQTIRTHIFRGSQLQFRPAGATNTTYFDVEGGDIQPNFRHFMGRAGWLQATLKLSTRPYGNTGAPRTVASFSGTGPVQFPATGTLGDALGKANLEVRVGSQVASSGRFIAYGLHSSASFSAIHKAPNFGFQQSGAAVVGASGAIGSQYLALPVSPTTASGIAFRDFLTPPGGYQGRHRVLAVLRSGLSPQGALTLYAKDRFGNRLGPTVVASQNDVTKWQVADLGEINVPARLPGQEPVPTQFVEVIAGGAPGAGINASPGFHVNSLVYVPLDISAGIMRTPGYVNAGLTYSDDFTTAADYADLNGRKGVNGAWSKLFGTLFTLQGLVCPEASYVAGSGMYSFASGARVGDSRAEVAVRLLPLSASAVASGAIVELWQKGIASGAAATVGVRAKLVLGPSAAHSVALLSHDGTGTTLHASAGLGGSTASGFYSGQPFTLTLETAGGEGRVWLATNGAVGSPLLNPSHAILGLSGHPMLSAQVASYFAVNSLRLDNFRAQPYASAPDSDAREWFRFESWPETRANQANASVFKNNMLGYLRGGLPRVPPVASGPLSTGPAQAVVMQGEVDDYLGNDGVDVRLDVVEGFSFIR